MTYFAMTDLLLTQRRASRILKLNVGPGVDVDAMDISFSGFTQCGQSCHEEHLDTIGPFLTKKKNVTIRDI